MQRVISSDGTGIAFDRRGEGPPVVLVSGALRHRSLDPVGERLAELLAPRFTVYRYDRRGRGDSGDTAPYAVAREVEDLEAVIAEAGGSVFVCGFSSGAVIALDAARRLPGIARLALYEPPFVVDATRPPLPEDYVTRLDGLVARGRRGEAVEFFMTRAAGVPAEAVARSRSTAGWRAFEAVAHTLAYDGAVMRTTMAGRPLPADRWSCVTAPVLVADGGRSRDYLRTGARALAAVLPGARHLTLEGQSHAVDPAVLAPVLETFFTVSQECPPSL
ncbi:alpha/beta fold hydrolase [Streptosporangium sandarakinum]